MVLKNYFLLFSSENSIRVKLKIFILKRHIHTYLHMKLCDAWDLIKYNLGEEKRVGVEMKRADYILMGTLSYYIILFGFLYLKFAHN